MAADMEAEYHMEYNWTNYSNQYAQDSANNQTLMMTFLQYYLGSTEYSWVKRLKTFIPPVFVLVGSIGNLLAVVALTRKHMLHNSVCFYFAVLCAIDTIILYVGCGLDWLSFVSATSHVANLGDPICKVWMFLFKAILAMMSWITVAALVDRFLVMWHPIKAQYICTVFLAKVTTVLILVAVISVCIHAMWSMRLTPHYADPNRTIIVYYCSPGEPDFLTAVWPLIQATLTTYLPMLLTTILTLLIIVGCVYPHDRGDSEHHQMRLTRAVVVTGLAYIVLELPTIVVNFVELFGPQFRDFKTSSRLQLTKEICQLLRCLNNAVIFALLFTCVPMLRYEMWCLVHHFKSSKASPGHRELRGMAPNSEHLLAPGRSIEVASEVTLL